MKSFLFIAAFIAVIPLSSSFNSAAADPVISTLDACYPHGALTDATGSTYEFLHLDALSQIQTDAIGQLRAQFDQALVNTFSTNRSMSNATLTVAEAIEDWLRNEPARGILESVALRNALATYEDDVSQRLSIYNTASFDSTEQSVRDHARYLEKSRATVAYFNLKNAMSAFTWSNGVQNTFARASICPAGFFHLSDAEATRQGVLFEQWIQRDATLNSSDHNRVRRDLLSETSFEYRYSMRMNLPPPGEQLIQFARLDLEQNSHLVEEDVVSRLDIPDHESAEQRDHRIHRQEYLERYLDFFSNHIPFKQFYINQCINGRGQVASPTLTFHLNLNLRHQPRITLSATASKPVQMGNASFDVMVSDVRHIDQLDPREASTFGRFGGPVSNFTSEAIPPTNLYQLDGAVNMPGIEELWFHLHPQCHDRPLPTTRANAPGGSSHHRHHGHHRRRHH